VVIRTTSRYKRDVKRAKSRGKNPHELHRIVEALLVGEDLADRHRVHRLSGRWAGYWECHIEPDWLLIWTYQDDVLLLVRTGTHADLFG